MKRKTTEEYKSELSKCNPNIECVEEYKGTNTKILHKCLKCGREWSVQPANILSGTACPVCSYKDMGKKKTRSTQEYRDLLAKINPNIYPLGEYTYSKEKILHGCKVCGTHFMLDPNHAMQGVGCSYCNNTKRIQKRTKSQDEYVSQCAVVSPNIKIIGKYSGARRPIEVECLVCGYHWSPMAGNVIRGSGCPVCADRATSARCKKTTEEYKLELNTKFPDIFAKEPYKGASVSILHHCNKCGNDFYARPANVLSYGCGQCRKPYSGEERVKQFLRRYNVPYIHNYRFADLKGKRNPLSYDFYLPKHNRLIEFQGAQHEYPVNYFGGENHFAMQQKHDFLKRKYAFDHNIKLIEIWHYDFDKIEKILQNELNIESVETVTET